MAAAIGDGTVAPSVFLRTISTYRRQNKLNVALHELGRIERTLSTLDWLEQPELSIGVQSGPPIGAQKGPPLRCEGRLILGAGFALLAA